LCGHHHLMKCHTLFRWNQIWLSNIILVNAGSGSALVTRVTNFKKGVTYGAFFYAFLCIGAHQDLSVSRQPKDTRLSDRYLLPVKPSLEEAIKRRKLALGG
jgi:hypothetical protein